MPMPMTTTTTTTTKTSVETFITNASPEEKPTRIEKNRGARSWARCFFLRRRFFIGMALTFLAFIATLEALHAYSNHNNGFVTAVESQALLWHYGPVIALSLIAGIWGQLEYSTARSLPWLQLLPKPNPLPPGKNILLNYVSPWSIVSLFRSLLARHFPVTIATFGGLLLKVAIIISTGLLSLEQRRLSYPTKLNLQDSFNMTKAFDGRSESPMNLVFILTAVTEQGEPYPRGLTADVAALSVISNTSDSRSYLGSNMSLTAAVPAFQSELQDCEPFSWVFNNSNKRPGQSLSDMGMPSADIEKLSPFCYAYRPSSRNATGPLLTTDSSTFELDNVILVFKRPMCTADLYGLDSLSEIRDIKEFGLFTSVSVDRPDNTSSVTALLCTPRHSITRRRVASSDGYITSVSSEVLETLDLEELPSVVTASLFLRHRRASGDLVSSPELLREDPWVLLMDYITPKDEPRNFSDPKIFETALRRTWKTVSAIAAKVDNTVPSVNVETVEATVEFTAGRLVVVPVPLRVVEAILVVLVVGLLLLAVFDFSAVKESPPSLLHSAIVLSDSEELERRMLSDVSPAMPQRFGESLHGHLFSSRSDGGRVRVVVDSVWQHDPLPDFRAPSKRKLGEWWLPTAATRGFRIGLLLTTVVFFVLLEVLFQLSIKNRGLADLTTSRWARYSYNWAPAIAVSGLGLAYVATDRAVRELHVYTQLSRVNKPANLSTLRFEAMSISPAALVGALRRQYHGLAALIVCSILASALTISASGLFVAETVPRSELAELPPLGWFDIRNASQSKFVDPSPSEQSQSALYNQGIQFHNISAPSGIYGPFVFAALDTKWVDASPASRRAKLHAHIPAVRSQANCTLYSHQPILRNVTRRVFKVNVTPPAGCTPGPNERLSDGKFISLSANAGQAPHSGFFGFVSQLTWSLLPIATDNETGMYTPVNRDPYTVCADSTQHTWIHYGHYDEDAFEVHDLTVLHCIPFVEALEVEATFNLPDLTVDDTSVPPKPARLPIPWGSRNRTLNSIPFTGPLPFSGTGMNNDAFFSVVTRGLHGVPGSDLLGRDKVDAMIEKINEVYQELSAVFLHANCRVSWGGNSDNGTANPEEVVEGRPVPDPIRGEVISFGDSEVTIRLVQKEIPTRLLEGLLLCMACLGILVFWIVGDLEVLPRDPGSIAAEMSLFAGSRMVERLRKGEERGLEGERLRLGWWDSSSGEVADGAGKGRRYGVDIVGGGGWNGARDKG